MQSIATMEVKKERQEEGKHDDGIAYLDDGDEHDDDNENDGEWHKTP